MAQLSKLLNRINFNTPGLEKAEESFVMNDYDTCMDEVIAHFRSRTSPQYLFSADQMKQLKDEEILKEAGKVMEHDIYGYHFPGEIDWFFNPTADTSRDNEWSWSLFRHIYWQPLARAYALTGDETYTKEFLNQMNSFAKSWPVKPFMEDDTFEAKYKFPGHAWRTIETAMRIYTSWLPCMEAFRSSPAWEKEDWVTFLILICDHGDFLMSHYSNHEKSSNWLTMESSALLQCGILFPEIRSDWLVTGYQRVMHEMKYSFDNDGIHMERTPIYHMVAAGAYLQAWRMCVKNNIPTPPYGLPTMEKAAEFIMKLVKPDFTTPMIGDADRNELLARYSDTSLYEGMNLTFDPIELNEMRGYFRTMYEITGREDFLYFATGRNQGKAPEKRNFAFRDAGIYVMRTGWEEEDSYFHVHGVQLERGEKSTHSHNDTGHVELHIKGEDILTDSGRYIYNSSCYKDWRHYFLSAKAHNTLYVDDHEMGTVPGVSRVRGVRTYCHRFEETSEYQIIDVSHNGYVFTDDPIYHRRKVIHLADDIYVIDDEITGLGKQNHDLRLYFNFAFGTLTEEGKDKFAYTSQKGRRYSITSLSTAKTQCHMLCGSEKPIGGWISYGYGWRKPIPQLSICTDGCVPIRFLTVIAPEGIGVSGEVNMEQAHLDLTGGTVLNQVVLGEEISISKRQVEK